MTKNEFLAECKSFAKALPNYSISDLGQHFNVFSDRKSKFVWACATQTYLVEGTGSTGNASSHNVVVAYYVEDGTGLETVSMWCGDSFFEGTVKDSVVRMSKAVARAEKAFPDLDAALLKSKLASGYGKGSKSTGCNFWALRNGSGEYCKHAKAVMNQLDESVLDRIEAAWREVMQPSTVVTTVPASAVCAKDELTLSAFVAPVLIIGPAAAGKTHVARAMADDVSVSFVEYGAHEGTEPVDLLGHNSPHGGGWCWKDGPVTEAFRRAERGERVLLCLDELLRVKARHLTPLLTAFSEFRGKYRLRTGRVLSVIDGVGCEETLIVDASNLAIVATTNIGGQFDIDSLDPAIKSRFKLIYMDGTGDTLLAAVNEVVSKRGWTKGLTAKLIKAHAQTEKSRKSGVLHSALDLRALRRSVMMATTEAEVAKFLLGERLQCVGLDGEGKPIPEQEAHYQKLIEKVMA